MSAKNGFACLILLEEFINVLMSFCRLFASVIQIENDGRHIYYEIALFVNLKFISFQYPLHLYLIKITK